MPDFPLISRRAKPAPESVKEAWKKETIKPKDFTVGGKRRHSFEVLQRKRGCKPKSKGEAHPKSCHCSRP